MGVKGRPGGGGEGTNPNPTPPLPLPLPLALTLALPLTLSFSEMIEGVMSFCLGMSLRQRWLGLGVRVRGEG